MATLAGSHRANAAGLPRGRGSLPLADTREAQSRRLVRAAIAAFADLGYAATTVQDIVSRARVSRQAFYELFKTKEDCFLAAEQLGRKALFAGLGPSLPVGKFKSVGKQDDAWLRRPVRTYLRICADEPQFVRAWIVEFPNAGPRTLARRNAFFVELAEVLRQGHRHALADRPRCSADLPDAFYEAAIGGAHELVFRCVSQNRTSQLPGLEDAIVAFILAVLGFGERGAPAVLQSEIPISRRKAPR